MGLDYIKNVANIDLDRDKCMGCGMCIDVCVHEVFSMDRDNKKVFIFDKDRCIECGACAKNCPFNALYVKSGTG